MLVSLAAILSSVWREINPSNTTHELPRLEAKKQSCTATFMQHHTGEMRDSSYSFLTLALDGVSGQLHAPSALYPRGKGPHGTCWIEPEWASELLWTQEDRGKICCYCWGSNPSRPVFSETLLSLSTSHLFCLRKTGNVPSHFSTS
jgi:hypothetical protein